MNEFMIKIFGLYGNSCWNSVMDEMKYNICSQSYDWQTNDMTLDDGFKYNFIHTHHTNGFVLTVHSTLNATARI